MSRPTDTPQRDQFGRRIENLATAIAIEERPALEVEEAPEARGSRHVYWLIGVLCVLTIGVAEIGILARGQPTGAPPRSAKVTAKFDGDACAARIAAIVKAVSTYAEQHGGPPPNLAVLTPDYLPFPAIDPASNQPYGYQVIGESVSVSCPRAAVNAAAGQPAGT